MSTDLVIAAKHVQKGDYLWNSLAKHPAFQWVRVTNVEQREDKQIHITTTTWETFQHPEVGIAVRRFDNDQVC